MVVTEVEVARQVRIAKIEAGFALAATLAVCVRTEWAHGPNGVAMAVVLPAAMAFSVHGLHNASGLGAWNLVYVPMRGAALIAGLAYSYSHYLAMLPTEPLLVAGRDIRWIVAVVVELLTISALVAHQGHSTRLHHTRTTSSDHADHQALAIDTSDGDDRPGSDVTGKLDALGVLETAASESRTPIGPPPTAPVPQPAQAPEGVGVPGPIRFGPVSASSNGAAQQPTTGES